MLKNFRRQGLKQGALGIVVTLRNFAVFTLFWFLSNNFANAQDTLLEDDFEPPNELAILATSMAVGSWAPLATNFPNNSVQDFFLSPQGTDYDLDYADSGRWDPISGCLYFFGGGHEEIPVFIRYCAATNTWNDEPLPPWLDLNDTVGSSEHGYDGNAMDVERRYHYFHSSFADGGRTWRYNFTNRVWTQLPKDNAIVAQALEYFPGLGLLLLDAENREVLRFNEGNQNWEAFASNVLDINYHNYAEYSAVHNMMIFGGGNNSRKVWRINAQGTVQRVTDAPIEIHTIDGDGGNFRGGLVTVDPVSGDFIHLNTNRQLYVYEPDIDRWSTAGSTGMVNDVAFIIGIPITSYGVIMYVQYSGGGPGRSPVWLYKHAQG